MTAVRLDGIRIQPGAVVEVAETTKLRFDVDDAVGEPHLDIADEPVPLVRESDGRWSTEPTWIEQHATTHLVGECPVRYQDDATSFRATVRRTPSRMTLDAYGWLLDWFAARDTLADGAETRDRAQIWAELSPRTPDATSERAWAALLLWRRAASAMRQVFTAPVLSLRHDDRWISIARLGTVPGRRIDPRAFRRSDPLWPAERPVRGSVRVAASEEHYDTAENRYVLAVAGELVQRLWSVVADTALPLALRDRAAAAAAELAALQRSGEWSRLSPGPPPRHSFLLRDHPAYRTIAAVGSELRRGTTVLLRFAPSDVLRSVPISPWSLNLLFERWVSTMVLEWLERHTGRLNRPRVPAAGSWTVRTQGSEITVRVDEPYPRTPNGGVFCPAGKNRPDVAVEGRIGGQTTVATIDATWSRNPALHEEKLGYGRTLIDAGTRSTLTRAMRPCVAVAAAVYPAPTTHVDERRHAFAETIIGLAPAPEAVAVFESWLDAAVLPLVQPTALD